MLCCNLDSGALLLTPLEWTHIKESLFLMDSFALDFSDFVSVIRWKGLRYVAMVYR